jgi:hypothetical protein
MRYRNTKTGQIIDVPSTLRGNWERIDGGKKPETDSSAVPVPVPVQNVEEEVKTTAKPKRTRKSKK